MNKCPIMRSFDIYFDLSIGTGGGMRHRAVGVIHVLAIMRSHGRSTTAFPALAPVSFRAGVVTCNDLQT
jgi:hypothetical protein